MSQEAAGEKSDAAVDAGTTVADVHLSEHEGATKFYVMYNKKSIPLYFDIVCVHLFHTFFFCCCCGCHSWYALRLMRQ